MQTAIIVLIKAIWYSIAIIIFLIFSLPITILSLGILRDVAFTPLAILNGAFEPIISELEIAQYVKRLENAWKAMLWEEVCRQHRK